MDDGRANNEQSLEAVIERLSPDAYYQSPGGRRFLIAAALLAGLPRGARVLDVECGIGTASVDLAEAFGCRVVAFDNYAPYTAFGRQHAVSRGVGKLVNFRPLDGPAATGAFEAESFDLVLGLGGGLSDTLPGGLAGGLDAAARWCARGGHLILGDLVSPGPPSELMRHVFGASLLAEGDVFAALALAGFELVFAARATSADWDAMRTTMARLKERSLDLGPPDERDRQKLTDAASSHPELAYLSLLARRR